MIRCMNYGYILVIYINIIMAEMARMARCRLMWML